MKCDVENGPEWKRKGEKKRKATVLFLCIVREKYMGQRREERISFACINLVRDQLLG